MTEHKYPLLRTMNEHDLYVNVALALLTKSGGADPYTCGQRDGLPVRPLCPKRPNIDGTGTLIKAIVIQPARLRAVLRLRMIPIEAAQPFRSETIRRTSSQIVP